MAGHRRDIDDLLALELARGRTIQAAAESVGCAERTARRRLAEPEFKAKVAALRAEFIDRTTGALADFPGRRDQHVTRTAHRCR
jgi:hypothetical protein